MKFFDHWQFLLTSKSLLTEKKQGCGNSSLFLHVQLGVQSVYQQATLIAIQEDKLAFLNCEGQTNIMLSDNRHGFSSFTCTCRLVVSHCLYSARILR